MDNGLYNSLREKLLYQETLDLDDEGVREALTDLLDKGKPMKLEIDGEFDLLCAGCGSVLDFKGCDGDYCPNCGQKLDWED